MRVLGVLLIVLAIACSPLGVQVNEGSSADGASGDEFVCEAPDPRRALNLPQLLDVQPGEFIPLNTKGYNYRPQSEWSPRIPTTPACPAPDED